jgi:hypothetical protein
MSPAQPVLTIVCRACKFDQFHLSALSVDAQGRGDVQIRCVRCGCHEFAGIDPAEELELKGQYVYQQGTLM